MLVSIGASGRAAGPVPWIHWRCRSAGISLPVNAPSRACLTVRSVRAIFADGSRNAEALAIARPRGPARDARRHDAAAIGVEVRERLEGAAARRA